MEVITDKKPAGNPLHIEYNFRCGITAWQEELTLKQDKKLAKLLGKINKDKFADLSKVQISEFLDLLLNENLLDEALNIILNVSVPAPEPGELCDFSDLTNTELESVVVDFFTLNPTLKKWLGISKNAPAGGLMNPSTQTPTQN